MHRHFATICYIADTPGAPFAVESRGFNQHTKKRSLSNSQCKICISWLNISLINSRNSIDYTCYERRHPACEHDTSVTSYSWRSTANKDFANRKPKKAGLLKNWLLSFHRDSGNGMLFDSMRITEFIYWLR